ncbi:MULTISPECIES: hypothetical protein [Acinetobacter]|uniref:Uncharacterized protein n=1 Tax=Acinetobacter indicus TaxID=756892 RepID=A0A6C0Y6I8_9GAMM|nr:MULTISPECIES: hypothetical protein [Acinetobacter]QIC71854.1 hypothetical protein FSC09_15810 [Acinetobacter indicus]QKQ71390.1 hypothetical protein E5Y90_14260 [Acinetobacter sp. 10FS3-1]
MPIQDLQRLRLAFEQLSEIAPLIKHATYAKDVNKYFDKNGLGEKGLFFLNGAWWAYQEQQKKIDAAIEYLYQPSNENNDVKIDNARFVLENGCIEDEQLMKPNEYVKQYGVDTFRLALSCSMNKKKYIIVYDDELDFTDVVKPRHGKFVFPRKDVERIVQAWDVVGQYKSLDEARKQGQGLVFSGRDGDAHRILNAVATYESCL